MSILILGDGLLGTELVKQTGWDYVSRVKNGFDITTPNENWLSFLGTSEHGVVFYNNYDTIVNTIAFTETYSEDYKKHWEVNVEGTKKLIDYCNVNKIKLVQISTDYIYAGTDKPASETDPPVHCPTWYGYSKVISDAIVQLYCDNFLVIRSTHKPNPFPYDKALLFQYGNFDYVDKIAELIIKLINKNATGVFNVGTEQKSMLTLARRTKPDVRLLPKLNKHTPENVTMDVSKMENFLNDG